MNGIQKEIGMKDPALTQKLQRKTIVRAVLAPLFLFGILFLIAWRWDYWQGWVYIILNTIVMLAMGALFTKNSELIEERLNPREGMKNWDKVYFGITTPLYILALVLAGLDAHFHWTTNMALSVYWIGVVIHVIGHAIFMWARYTNNYFSSVVRIQADRGQTVCKDGPYRYVRHPGYVGGFIFTATSGIVLGSWWACIPQVTAALMLIWRTALEDKTLQVELPGFAEYTKETRYRLLPGVW